MKNTPAVLAFDVFGTVVDWYGTVSREIESLDSGVNGSEFALAWRAGYAPAMQRVSSGELPWTLIDDLHRMILEQILPEFGLNQLSEAQKLNLNSVWHRLIPWEDSVQGLHRLKSDFRICTLSNGNYELLSDMAQSAGLPWDKILCAETFLKYKPDPDTYLGVAKSFNVDTADVMMVAAHQSDLDAARACGLMTAYIERPLEYGPDKPKKIVIEPANNYHAKSILDLAHLLGC